MSNPRNDAEREAIFWLRVEKHEGDGCWLWTGGQTSKGAAGGPKYGGFAYPGGTLAHRYSWELANGQPVPKGLAVCHHCDNPLCVRPEHLYVGTQQRNMRDAVRRGRIRRKGVENGNAKLTWEKVRAIRASAKSDIEEALAHGVCVMSIYKIRRGLSWREEGVVTL